MDQATHKILDMALRQAHDYCKVERPLLSVFWWEELAVIAHAAAQVRLQTLYSDCKRIFQN